MNLFLLFVCFLSAFLAKPGCASLRGGQPPKVWEEICEEIEKAGPSMTIIQLHDIVMARFKESGEASYSQWREKYVDKAIAPPNKIPKRDALKETLEDMQQKVWDGEVHANIKALVYVEGFRPPPPPPPGSGNSESPVLPPGDLPLPPGLPPGPPPPPSGPPAVGGEEKPPLVSPDYKGTRTKIQSLRDALYSAGYQLEETKTKWVGNAGLLTEGEKMKWSTERFYNQNFQTRFAAKGPMWWDKATERVPETAGWREAVKAVVEKIGVASSKFEDMREDIIKSTTVYWGKNKPPAITAEEVVNMSEKVITVAEQITTALNELVNGSEMKAVKKGERAGEGEKGAGVTRMSRGAIRLVVRKFNDKLIPAAMELKKDVNNYVPYTGGA